MPNTYLTQAAECLHDAEILLDKVQNEADACRSPILERKDKNGHRLFIVNELLVKARGFLERVNRFYPGEDTKELWAKQRKLRRRWKQLEYNKGTSNDVQQTQK